MTNASSYPINAIREVEAITALRSILDPSRIMPHIDELNTIPDIDGYLDILDETRSPVGKLDVQVKKLPDHEGTDPKLEIKVTLYGYASKATNNPVLLIGVDIGSKIAHWVHIPIDSTFKPGQENTTVHFPLNQIIDGHNTRYVVDWLQIARDFQWKLRHYTEKENAFLRLSKIVNAAGGASKTEFREIHSFLDSINYSLDGDYSLIKRRYYSAAWKVGLAYYNYSVNSISYTVFPIPYELNDIQIKEVDEKSGAEFLALNAVSIFPDANPIKKNPSQHATDFIRTLLDEILKNRMLEHRNSQTLATEFLFAFVDTYAEEMGLEIKDTYKLAEIEEGFYHLWVWVDQAIRFLIREKRYSKPSDLGFGRPYIDPGLLKSLVAPQMHEIEAEVGKIIKAGGPFPTYPLGSEKVPFGMFTEFEAFLLSTRVTEIQRLYRRQDFSRLEKSGGLKWATYSVADLEWNLRVFFENFPSAYGSMLQQNFPRLKDQLKPFGGATRVAVFFDAKEEYKSMQEAPSIMFYYLKGANEQELRIDLRKKGEDTNLEQSLAKIKLGENVQIDGESYVWIGGPRMVLDFIFEDLPLLTLIYEQMTDAFRYIFEYMEIK